MQAKSVTLKNVSKCFGDVEAIQPLQLDIQQGEFLTLLGPSGCGKTTLLRMVAGLESVSSGSILVDSVDVTTRPPNQRDTSIMFQDYALFPHKSVADNISYGLKMAGIDKGTQKRQIGEWLERIQLEGYGPRFPHQLSGGQRQRVALARALIIEPSVLLLDEPLGALDANLRHQLQDELKRIHREVGITFIAVTHDQEEALTMSDRIAIMRNGCVEQLGNPLSIYETPKTEFVARFVGRCNIFNGHVIDTSSEATWVMTEELGIVQALDDKRAMPGDQVRLALRPESIQISAPGTAFETIAATPPSSIYSDTYTQSVKTAQLMDVAFSGSDYRLALQTLNGKSVEVVVPRHSYLPVIGDNVALQVKSATATLLQKPQ